MTKRKTLSPTFNLVSELLANQLAIEQLRSTDELRNGGTCATRRAGLPKHPGVRLDKSVGKVIVLA